MFKKSSVCAKAAPHHSFIQQALCLPVRHLPMSHTLRFSTVDSASALRCALTAAKFQPCPTQTRILTFSKGSGSYWENVCVRRWSLFIRNESISEPQWEGWRGSAAFFWMKLLHGRPLPLLPASLAPSLDWSRLPVTDVRQTLVDEPARKNIHSASSERFGEFEEGEMQATPGESLAQLWWRRERGAVSTREPSVFKPAVEPYREQPHLGSITCAGSYTRKREKNQCDSRRGLTRLNKVRGI